MEGKPNKHSKAFEKRLLENEEVIQVAEGYIGKMMGKGDDTQHNGSLLLTNQRVVFYRKGMLGEVLKTVPFENISSVDTLSSMGHRTISMFYSNNSMEFKTFEKKEFIDEFVFKIKSSLKEPTSISADSGGSNELTFAEKLEKLAELHKAGILTDEEFSAKKSEILGEI